MAAGTKLICEFYNASGAVTSHTYNYAASSASAAGVKAYMNAAIGQSSMFKNPPVSIKGAKIQVTTESVINLDS